MRKFLTINFILLTILPLWSFAQDEQKSAMQDALKERQSFYQLYADSKEGFDTTETNMVSLAGKMEQVIKLDDIIIDQYLFKEFDRANELQTKLEKSEKETKNLKAKVSEKELIFLIAAGGGGFMFLMFIIFLILFIVKGGKSKKVTKIISEKDELLGTQQAKLAENEKQLADQSAQFKKEIDTLKSSAEQERKTYKTKEEEYQRQVTNIEERIKKLAQKESDMNYQIFQLELRLKNELEGTLKEKCLAENKVIELEHELSEAKMKLDEEIKKPRGNEMEFKDMHEKINWLEGETRHLRQWAENEKQAKENAERLLNEKNNETEGLYRERDELWGRINHFEGRLNELQNSINDLNSQIGNLHNEKNYLEEQLRNSSGGGQQIQDLNNRVADLERQLGELHDEKNRLYAHIDELKPRAEEAAQLRNQLDELLRFVDRLRSGS